MDSNIGFYGKMPSRGDFVRRQLSDEFVAGWDSWLQRYLADSRERLGERWLDLYLTAPIWRFALSAQVVDEHCWVGAIMPSVDEVNRYFPLTVAVKLTHDGMMSVLTSDLSWLDRIEVTMLQALDNDYLDVDEFASNLAVLSPTPSEDQGAPDFVRFGNEGQIAAIEVQADTPVGQVVPALLQSIAHHGDNTSVVFWSKKNAGQLVRSTTSLALEPIDYDWLLADESSEHSGLPNPQSGGLVDIDSLISQT